MSYKERKMKRIPKSKLNQIPFIKKMNLNLTNLGDINYISGLQILNVSGNPLQSFENLPDLPTLHTLIANNTQIYSLKGALLLPALQELSLQNTPISTEPNFEIMCLSAFGTTIRNLNDCLVSIKNKKVANEIRPKIYPYLTKGYVLDSIKPLVVYMPNELPMKKIKVDLEPSESQEKENQIEDNKQTIKDLKKKIKELQKKRKDLSQDSEQQILKNYTTPIHIRKKKTSTNKKSQNTPSSSTLENQTKEKDTESNNDTGKTSNETSDTQKIEQPDQNNKDEILTSNIEENTTVEKDTNNQGNQENTAANYENEFLGDNSNDNILIQNEEYIHQENEEDIHQENDEGHHQDEPEYKLQDQNENQVNDTVNQENPNNDYLNQLMDEDQHESIEIPNENIDNQLTNNEETNIIKIREQELPNDQYQNDNNDDNEYLNQLIDNEHIDNTNNEEAIPSQNQDDIQDEEYLNQLMNDEETNNTNNEEAVNSDEIQNNDASNNFENLDQENFENLDQENFENPDQNNFENLDQNNFENLDQNNLENPEQNNPDDDDALLQMLLDADPTDEKDDLDQVDAGKRMPKPPLPANSKNSSVNISALRPATSGHKMMSSASIDQELNAIRAIDPPDNDNSGFIKPEGNDYENLSEIAQPTTPTDDHSIDDILNADVSNDD